jgi:sulfite exporter TauE/SafE
VQSGYLVALLIGLSSSPHCLGMCGAIGGALSLSLPARVRQRRHRLIGYNLLFSLGRIASYALAGALAGSLAGSLAPLAQAQWLRLLPALTVVLAGLYLSGWLPRLALVDRLGTPLWRHLEPLGRRLIPIRSPLQALAYGLVWGWLPCGLVYWALAIAASTGHAGKSMLFMVSFGIATLPAILATGLLAGWLHRFRGQMLFNRAAGLLLICLGLAGVYHSIDLEPFSRPSP